jgi:hypothetical protein
MADFLSAHTVPFPAFIPACRKAANQLKIRKKIFLGFLSPRKLAG